MRLASLTLQRYGNFEDERIVLDPTPGRVNLILAPNGAGKSVLRQAFADLLCGIGGQSPMGFRFGYPGMRLMTEAVLADGATLAFGRRKGMGNTLIDGAGAPLDRAVLDAVLGSADRPLLQRLFALDTALLREGGEGLLASGGALADALVSAAGGLRQARGVLAGLRAARDELAPERKAATRPFYQALDTFNTARKELDDATLTPEAWARGEAALEQARARRAAANAAALAASRRIAQLERIRRVRPLLAEHDAAAGWLSDHADAPVLPEGLGERLAAAREAVRRRADACLAAGQRCARAQDEIAALAPDPATLAEADAIEALVPQAGAARKAQEDLPGVEAEHRQALQEVGRLLRELGSTARPEQAADAVPRPPLLRVARALIAEHHRLAPDLDRLPATIGLLDRQRAEARGALEVLPTPGDTAGLAALVREIRADGDPARRAADAAALARRKRGAAAVARALVSGWKGSPAELEALMVPAAVVFERLDRARSQAHQAQEAAATDVARAAAALAEARQRLHALGEAADLIDPDAVAAARRQRDQGWDLVYRQAFTDQPPMPEEVGQWSGGAALPVAYSRAVASADDIADRRGAWADRIATAAATDREVRHRASAQEVAEAALAQATVVREIATAAWADACAALGLAVGLAVGLAGGLAGGQAGATTIGGVREFIQGREAAIRAEHEAALDEAAERALAQAHAAWRTRLSAMLPSRQAIDLPLAAWLAEAELALQQHERDTAARAVAADRLRAVEGQLATAREALLEARARMADWQARWAASQAVLGRPADEAADLTVQVIELYGLVDSESRKAASLRQRSDGMAQDIARFSAEVAAVVARLDPGLEAHDRATAVRALQARLRVARSTADRLERAHQERQDAEAALAEAHAAQQQAIADLRAVVAAAGAADEPGAEARIALAMERAGHASRREAAAARLREAGDGLALAQLRAEAEAVDVDALPAEIAALRDSEAKARDDAQTAAAEETRVEADQLRAIGESRAVAARADQEAAVATMGRVLEQALLLHAAAGLLQQGLAEVEAAGTGGMLARITSSFGGLTGGTYEKVTTEEDANGAMVLRVVERGMPDHPKGVDELSEGTRDQLFLALRLVAIEDHLRSAPPLPFIADDILQTFDDERARHALEALALLSREVQVIVLSHHRHVERIAERLGGVHVHRIGGMAAE